MSQPPDLAPPSDDELRVLHAILEGTVANTGEAYFEQLVRHLTRVLGVRHAFVAEFLHDLEIRTLAFWVDGRLVPNEAWNVRGTPCEDVVAGNLCHYPDDVEARFPDDPSIPALGLRSYLGVPLRDAAGQHLGHLAVFDSDAMPAEPRNLTVFRIFAAQAAAELTRLRDARRLAESEQRYRDLFDEAPIAYVHEGVDTRFLDANRAAQRILGLRPDEVLTTLGRTLVPDDPAAQHRLADALAAIGGNEDAAGKLLELRRKDTGEPVWVQWWSRPDPAGSSTRTMFLDVTDRVRAERERARLELQNDYLREELQSVHNFEEIVGRSPALLRVLDDVRRVAPTEATVLILGETGTGKELIARALHDASPRNARPLIKVNCAALPTGLVESELFGHERGAFSGAIARRIGRFELANGGTIFLDEIGELMPDVQAKLLRVLQEREFERVGGQATFKTDVRLIAATNRDLQQAVAAGTFRQDLFYRLNVFPLRLPPLRERAEDVPLLVRFLLARQAKRLGRRIDGVDAESLARLLQYPWPGNVRELENVIERAAILGTGPLLRIDPALLPTVDTAPPTGAGPAVDPARPTDLQRLERDHILDVLARTGWVIDGDRGAAVLLGLHPNTLRSRLKRLGLRRPPAE